MEQTENKLFKSSALAYNEVYNIVRTLTSAASPLKVSQIFELCDNAKDRQQVQDALKKYILQDVVVYMREGKECIYWWKDSSVQKLIPKIESVESVESVAAIEKVEPTVIIEKVPACKFDRPEITVGATSVTIVNSKIKITIEFN